MNIQRKRMGVAPAIDLTVRQRRTVLVLLNRYLPGTTVWAYGSRVKWTSHPASDLDLVVFAKPEQAARVTELREAFDESNLPFRVDLFVWDDVPESFRKRIETEHVTLAKREERNRTVSNDWRTVTLGACATPVADKVAPADSGDLPYIGLEHIGQGTLSLNGIGSARDVESTKTAFCAGDILFGKLRPYFRKVVRPRFDGICSTDIWVFRPKEDVDAGFLFYLLASSEFVRFASQGAEGTRMPRVKWEQASRFSARLPPVSEQRAIVQVLGALDDKIDLNRRMATTLEDSLRALFQSWFVDFDPVRSQVRRAHVNFPTDVARLFPSRLTASDIGEIPDDWKVNSLGDLVELAYGSALRSNERRGGHIPVFGSNGQVGWHDRKIVNGPGIVVGRKGTPGVVTWSQSDFFPIDTTFYVVPKGKVSLQFLFYALRHQKLSSLAADSVVPGLNRNIAYMNRQVVPSAKVIEAFDGQADAVLSRVGQIEAESRTLAELRDTLLPKLLSGEIRIPEAEKVVAAAT